MSILKKRVETRQGLKRSEGPKTQQLFVACPLYSCLGKSPLDKPITSPKDTGRIRTKVATPPIEKCVPVKYTGETTDSRSDGSPKEVPIPTVDPVLVVSTRILTHLFTGRRVESFPVKVTPCHMEQGVSQGSLRPEVNTVTIGRVPIV